MSSSLYFSPGVFGGRYTRGTDGLAGHGYHGGDHVLRLDWDCG